jgi:hypothetical protein
MKCRYQPYLTGGNAISGPSSRLALPTTRSSSRAARSRTRRSSPRGYSSYRSPSPTRRLLGVAVLPAAGRTRDWNVIVGGSIPGPARRLIGVAVLPPAGRTRDWDVIVGGSIPGPARRLIGVAVLRGVPSACRRNLVVYAPVAAPVRRLVGIALLSAGRTADSGDVASGALLIRRVPLGRAPVLARGLGTFFLAARHSRVGALGIGRWGA